jgi:glycogen synthase
MEIQTSEYGEGLEGLLPARHFDMQGIVNGIDYTNYNPQTDEKLYVNYNLSNWRDYKFKNKENLQRDLGLEVDKNKFMIGLVSILTISVEHQLNNKLKSFNHFSNNLMNVGLSKKTLLNNFTVQNVNAF